MRADIEFAGCRGTVLRGWLYMPDTQGDVPVVIMTHGFSAVKEMALDSFAAVFCAAGLAVLVYDHRNLGASEGSPRQEINIWAQARDYRYAVSWVSTQPGIDAARVALWGSSFSAAEVLVVGACDDRVKAVAVNVPFASIGDVSYADETAAFEAIKNDLYDESGQGLADLPGEAMGPFSVVAEEGCELPVFIDKPEAQQWFTQQSLARGERWCNRVSLMNCFMTEPAFDPGLCAKFLSPKPLMMVIASADTISDTDASRITFDQAAEPKTLLMIEGGHFEPYQGEAFVLASNAMCEFLVQALQ